MISALSGCSTNITLVEPDGSVDQLFTSSRLPESYTYYAIGGHRGTNAVLGLQPGFSLSNTHWWVLLGSDVRAAAEAIGAIRHRSGRNAAIGGRVKDASGKAVGIWFSRTSMPWVEVDNASGKVTILLEDPSGGEMPRITDR